MYKIHGMHVFVILLIFAIFIDVYAIILSKGYHDSFLYNKFSACTGWNYESAESDNVSIDKFPYYVDTDKKQITISKKLPQKDLSDQVIAVRTHHQTITVIIDDELIYRYDAMDNRVLNKSQGNAWNYIKLKNKYAGKEIYVTLNAAYNGQVGEINQILIGKRTDLILSLIKENLYSITLCVIVFSMAIFLLVFYVAAKKVKGTERLLYLAIYSIILSLWSLTETKVIQLVLIHQETITIIAYEMLMLMPFPIVMFAIEYRKKSMIIIGKVLIYCEGILFVVVNGLLLLHLADYSEISIFIHLLVLFSLIFATILSISEKQKRPKKKNYLVAMVLIIVTGMICMDVYFFYTNQSGDYGFLYSRTGIILYLMLLGLQSIEEIFDSISEGLRANIYKGIVYKDILTDVYSHYAYVQDMNDLIEGQKQDNVTVMAIDINYLKAINDEFGHSEGDRYIKKCTDAITKILEEKGKCYRVGGDEFVIIFNGIDESTKRDLQLKFEKVINIARKNPQLVLSAQSVSFAYGMVHFDRSQDDSIYMTVARADKQMYEMKRNMKQEMENILLS